MAIKKHKGRKSDDAEGCFLKRFRRTEESEEPPNLEVKVGPETFNVRLMPLLRESLYFMRRVDTMVSSLAKKKGTRLHIDLPANLPCGPDIFKIVVNFCYHRMEETEVSTDNVVKLMVISDLLEIENLKSKVSKFLDDALKTWEGCLSVLSTFESDHLPEVSGQSPKPDTEDSDYDDSKDCDMPESLFALSKSLFEKLFEKSKNAFIDTMEKLNIANSMRSCNITCVLRVVEVLPMETAELVCESIVAKQFGLFYNSENTQKHLCDHVPSRSLRRSQYQVPSLWESRVQVQYYGDRDVVSSVLMENIRSVFIPDPSRRSLLIYYLAKLIRPGKTSTRNVTVVCFHFLCSLLVEATELMTTLENTVFGGDLLREEIGCLHKFVGSFFRVGIGEEASALFSGQHKIQTLLARFNFSTLLSIVENLGIFLDQERLVGVAKVFDTCLLAHLRDKSFTAQQVLQIYKEFPNHRRRSHVEIYRVLEDCLERKVLSQELLLQLSKIFDYNKLPDDIVERLWGEFGVGWTEARLRSRVMKILDGKRSEIQTKSVEELVRLRKELAEKTSVLKSVGDGKRQLESELVGLRCELSEKNVELESKKQAETDLLKLRKKLTRKTLELDTLRSEKILKLVTLRSEKTLRSEPLHERSTDPHKGRSRSSGLKAGELLEVKLEPHVKCVTSPPTPHADTPKPYCTRRLNLAT